MSNEQRNVVMDATMLSTLMSCERLFDFRFNHNLRPINGNGNAIETGQLMHKMLETLYKSKIAGAGNAIDLAIEAGHEYISKGEDGNGLANTFPDNEKHKNGQLKSIGWRYVIDTFLQYTEFYKNDSWVPLEVEKVKGRIIYEDDDLRVLWKAKLDLLVDTNNGIFPVDTKTMKQRRDILSLNNQFMGQCILSGSRSVIINRVGWQSSLEPKEKFTRELISYSASRLVEQLDVIVWYARYLVSLTESGYYPPRYSHCDKYAGCIFRDVCQADPGMRNEELAHQFVTGKVWDISDVEE